MVSFTTGTQRADNMYLEQHVAADVIPLCDLFARCVSCLQLHIVWYWPSTLRNARARTPPSPEPA